MDIPAKLEVTYPSFLEPGQSSPIEIKLETLGDRIIEIKPGLYIGIDLELPGVGLWIPNVGWKKSFQATYGGQWNMRFNLNSQNLEQMINRVWVGDFASSQYFSQVKTLTPYIKLQRVNINSAALGQLVLGEIRIDLLRALLDVLMTLTLTPFLKEIVHILDWLVSQVFRFSTGLIITPRISAFVSCPVYTDSVANVGSNMIKFETDLSSKKIPLNVASTAEEKSGSNEFRVYCTPIEFSYLFDVGWQYYFDVDVDFLGVDIYQNTWIFDIFRGPCVQWDSDAVQTVELVSRIDEPLKSTVPAAENGKVTIDLNDKSGISEAILHYSSDNASWNSLPLSDAGTTYSAVPITDVPEDTVVYYYFKVIDGDGDSYNIGGTDNCYSYVLKAKGFSLTSILQSPWTAIIGLGVIVLAVSITVAVFWKRRRRM